MSEILIAGLIIALLVALDVAAVRWGVDSREGFGDGRRPPGAPAVR
jgi:hypothetical protein